MCCVVFSLIIRSKKQTHTRARTRTQTHRPLTIPIWRRYFPLAARGFGHKDLERRVLGHTKLGKVLPARFEFDSMFPSVWLSWRFILRAQLPRQAGRRQTVASRTHTHAHTHARTHTHQSFLEKYGI